MNKIIPQTKDITTENINKIALLFPQVITEKEDKNGNTIKAIDFELLKQHLSKEIVEGADERYRLDWPGKRASILKANTPITSTLKPDRESSVNFDTTENVYIEGDNFEVLKILQESYLGKIKMIYIDPPYNTGTAMIYNNDFSVGEKEYAEELGVYNEDGVKMFKNTDTDGRIHSNWLSFMHERIIIARDLLTEDGFVFLAIDHYELNNLISVCNEVFGEENRIGIVSVVHKPEGRNQEKFFGTSNEFMLVFAKNKDKTNFNNIILTEEKKEEFNLTDSLGVYKQKNFIRLTDGKYATRENKPDFYYPIYVSQDLKQVSLKERENYIAVYPITQSLQERTWKTKGNTFIEYFKNGNIEIIKENESIIIYEKLRPNEVIKTHWVNKKYHSYHFGTKVINEIMKDKTFDFPKSLFLLIDILKLSTKDNDLILDFFSGSATTAHATMQLNTEDGGNRKFIMVQLPEETDEKSEAFKAGYKTIPEIGKERIRRAGKKILEENTEKLKEREIPLDVGFRVYKTSESILKDVAKHPNEVTQTTLFESEDNIRKDASSEDILTAVLLDFSEKLDHPIEKQVIANSEIFIVDTNALVACFDTAIDMQVVDAMAKIQPIKAVFRDACFIDDKDLINTVESRFKQLAPNTKVHVI
ncbi:site-specific DNA-methyltransferase [Tenacibaculum finnmarkense]|uniref:site-specific DNA-methyltransferase n=1 Tax=Tenacibaculum finnmarkense TaxID=2781243 RepID=UPI003BB7B0E8